MANRKEVLTYWDGRGKWRWNRRTHLLSLEVDGSTTYPAPSDDRAVRAFKVFEGRIARADARRVRDQIMRDHGMLKVKGALGRSHWE